MSHSSDIDKAGKVFSIRYYDVILMTTRFVPHRNITMYIASMHKNVQVNRRGTVESQRGEPGGCTAPREAGVN